MEDNPTARGHKRHPFGVECSGSDAFRGGVAGVGDVMAFAGEQLAQAQDALVREPSDSNGFGHVPQAVDFQAAVRDCAVRISYRMACST